MSTLLCIYVTMAPWLHRPIARWPSNAHSPMKKPRGTRSPGGLVRKSAYLTEEQASDLETFCFLSGRSESSVLQSAFASYLPVEISSLEDEGLSRTGEGTIEFRSIKGGRSRAS